MTMREPALSALAHALLDDARRDEYEELGLVVAPGAAAKQHAEERQISEERHFCDNGIDVLGINTADHDRAAVLHQHLGLHVLGVDREPGGGGLAYRVLVEIQLHDDVAVGRDLRRDLEGEIRLSEL